MSNTIILGNVTTRYKVGEDDCKIYLGDVLLYPHTAPSGGSIVYTASQKQRETTLEQDSGIHSNAFSGTSGQQLTILSHTFVEGQPSGSVITDGEGTIMFNDVLSCIGDYAFAGTSIVDVIMPNSVTEIGSHAFYNCLSLINMNIPSGVTVIGQGAFQECENLPSISIPNSVVEIGPRAFYFNLALTTVTIGSGVQEIKGGAFEGCQSLTSITCHAVTPPTLGNDVFEFTNDCPIYVPSASLNDYLADSSWGEYTNRLLALN